MTQPILWLLYLKPKEQKMKLTINYISRAGKILGLNTDEVQELARRMAGHLKKCGVHNVTKNQVIQALFIIKDIQDKQREERAKELHIKNPLLRKYQKEIKELSELGLGAQRISKELKTKYKINLSSSTIYRFLKGATDE
jgi:IS30 family transposase